MHHDNEAGATLGGLLRQEREAQGLSIRQLAALVDVVPSTIHKWEQNTWVPRARYLPALVRALELDARRFYALADVELPANASSLPAMLRAEYDLPPEAIAEAERAVARIARKYGAAKKTTTKSKQPRERRSHD